MVDILDKVILFGIHGCFVNDISIIISSFGIYFTPHECHYYREILTSSRLSGNQAGHCIWDSVPHIR